MSNTKFAEDDEDEIPAPLPRRKVRSQQPTNGLFGKIPPQAIELEAAVIGACMLERDCLPAIIEFLKPDHFYKPMHQAMFKAIILLFEQNQPVDVLTVTQQLKRSQELESVGGPYQVTLFTNRIASAANIEFHARIIVQKWIAREIIRISGNAMKNAFEDTQDEIILLDQVKTEIETIYSAFTGSANANAAEIAERSITQLEKNHGQIITIGKETGFPEFDEIIGGLCPANLIVLAARPGVGKSSLALQIAHHVASCGIPVDYFTLEMLKADLVNRIISFETDIDGKRIVRNQLSYEEIKKIRNAINKISKNLNIIDDSQLSMNKLKAHIVRDEPGLIVLDYLQLMIPSSNSRQQRNREQDVSEMSRGLKSIAMTYKIPVIALSQLSREVEKDSRKSKKPLLSDLRESGAIEQDADVVAFIFRPDIYKLDAPIDGMAELIIRKNRNGALKHIPLKFIPYLTKFENVTLAEKEKIFGEPITDEPF